MSLLIARVLRWIVQKLGLLLIIIGILVAAAWLNAEWTRLADDKRAIEIKEELLESQQAELRSIQEDIAAKAPHWVQAIRHLETVKEIAQDSRRRANRLKRELEALERQFHWWDSYLRPAKLAELNLARANYAAWEKAARSAERTRDRVAPKVDGSGVPRLFDERNRKVQEIDRFKELIQAERERIAENPTERLVTAVKANLATAALILIGLLLVPLAIKTFFYFVLAPIASRLSPIRIIPNAGAPALPEPRPSGVSVPIEIGPDEELLVQPGFLQSSSLPAKKHTVWFLNARIPIASIASGMFALTGIRPEGTAPTRAVVSSQNDVFGEVGVIEIPAGAAMVVQPRSLAGVVRPVGKSVAITRHWRLASLHAWLTLQLRYLAFHGPCKLILKGCRGVRSEEPQANQPRLINQAATIGFSANLDYRTTRCETFISYVRGQENLFNDLFGGGPGRFVYEEVPSLDGKTGTKGRGMEGMVDAVLKAFGI